MVIISSVLSGYWRFKKIDEYEISEFNRTVWNHSNKVISLNDSDLSDLGYFKIKNDTVRKQWTGIRQLTIYHYPSIRYQDRKDLPQSLKVITMTLLEESSSPLKTLRITMLFPAVCIAVTCVVLMLIPVKTMPPPRRWIEKRSIFGPDQGSSLISLINHAKNDCFKSQTGVFITKITIVTR